MEKKGCFMKCNLFKECVKSCDSLSESGIKWESMFLLVLLRYLAGLFAAHKLCISPQFFSQWAVSASLRAPGYFFDACLYWASSWAENSVSCLCSQTQEILVSAAPILHLLC